MGRLGMKIFGMSKQDYVNKYGPKMVVASGDYYNLNVEVFDKKEELSTMSSEKEQFEKKVHNLLQNEQSADQGFLGFSKTNNNKTPTPPSMSFEKYFKLMEMMEKSHQNKVQQLKSQINKLNAEKNHAQENPSAQKNNTTHASYKCSVNKHSSFKRDIEFRQPVVYPNGHHFPCQKEMWV